MSSLGKCFLFYLKYPAEMDRLYESDEPNTDGLQDAESVLEKVRRVGDAASREGAELLSACASRIEDHFRGVGTIRRIRRKLETTWSLAYKIAPNGSSPKNIQTGLLVDVHKSHLIPWVWCRGGRRAEDELVSILGAGTRGASLDWGPGHVVLAEIGIPVPDNLEEEVDSAPLVAQVQRAFASITREQIEAITTIANDVEDDDDRDSKVKES